MNRPTLKLNTQVNPKRLNQSWSRKKQEHDERKNPSKKQRKATLFLRRRVREENRNRNKQAQAVQKKESNQHRNPQDRLYKNTFVGKLSEESLEALASLKNDLATSTT